MEQDPIDETAAEDEVLNDTEIQKYVTIKPKKKPKVTETEESQFDVHNAFALIVVMLSILIIIVISMSVLYLIDRYRSSHQQVKKFNANELTAEPKMHKKSFVDESASKKAPFDLESSTNHLKEKMQSVKSINVTVNLNKEVNPVQYHNTFVIPAKNSILTPADTESPMSSSRSKIPNLFAMSDDFSPSLCNKQQFRRKTSASEAELEEKEDMSQRIERRASEAQPKSDKMQVNADKQRRVSLPGPRKDRRGSTLFTITEGEEETEMTVSKL